MMAHGLVPTQFVAEKGPVDRSKPEIAVSTLPMNGRTNVAKFSVLPAGPLFPSYVDKQVIGGAPSERLLKPQGTG